MKTRFFNILLLGIGIFAFNSCSETGSDEFCQDPGISCGAAVIESCCTDTECYWLYNGTKYTCSGTDCDAVYDIIVGKCTAASASFDISETEISAIKAQLQAVTQELLLEARGASGCNF